jgi:hypothetical protein
MKKGKQTEAEIIKAVNELEKGVSADSVSKTYNCRSCFMFVP